MEIINNYYDIRTTAPMTNEDWDALFEECMAEQRKVVAKASDDSEAIEKSNELANIIENTALSVSSVYKQVTSLSKLVYDTSEVVVSLTADFNKKIDDLSDLVCKLSEFTRLAHDGKAKPNDDDDDDWYY